MVSIDKTDGIQVYLSEKSKQAEIVTAKSSEMNILVPGADGDFVSLHFMLVACFSAENCGGGGDDNDDDDGGGDVFIR